MILLVGVAALVGLLAAGAVFTLWLRHRRRDGGLTEARRLVAPSHRAESWPAVGRHTTVGLRLVATGADADAIVFDGVVVDDDSPLGPLGWPVSVRLVQPESPELAASFHRLFHRWATNDTVVRFAADGADPRRRVAVTDGISKVQLTLPVYRRQRWTA